MRIVGIVLVSSFLVIPASIALLVCSGFKQTIVVSALVGIASVVAGLLLAYYLDLAAGGAIVLTLVAGFGAVLLYKEFSK
jgi:zinc transport system permease protein